MMDTLIEIFLPEYGVGQSAIGLVFVIQMTLVLFFVVAPLAGRLLSSVTRNWPNTVILALSLGLLFEGMAFVMIVVLRRWLTPAQMPDWIVGALAVVTAASLTWLVGRFVYWWMRDPGPSVFEREFASLSEDEMSPFDQRRLERLNKQQAHEAMQAPFDARARQVAPRKRKR